MSATRPSAAYRSKVESLARRKAWLDKRIEGYVGNSSSHDRAERAALEFAIAFIEHHKDAAVDFLRRS